MNQSRTQNKTSAPRFGKFGLIAGLLLGGLGISGYATASPNEIIVAPGYSAGIFIGINPGRDAPPLRREVIGRAPFHDAIWIPGQWVWRDRWVWYRGQWERRHHHLRERVYWAPRYPMHREERGYRGYDERRHDHGSGRHDDDQRGYRR